MGARVKMSNDVVQRIEELRQLGLARIRANEIEESLVLFDQALALATDDEAIELLTINKAGALISLERQGAEVQQLPQIVMRRRNLRHVYVAAYNLQHKFIIERNFARSAFYGRVALEAAEQAAQPAWKPEVLIALGNACVYDSKTSEAIGYYCEVLELLGDDESKLLSRSFAMQNLGYCRLLNDEAEDGIALIHRAIGMMRSAGAEGYVAESYVDLCYGYLELENLELALKYGELGLEKATEVRQVRNAHYLLGEVAYKSGDTARAEFHFDHLASFYPDFPHLKDLLLAIDLRGMVNLKL
jgi:tetratricopeptide (TPR) repeat protein